MAVDATPLLKRRGCILAKIETTTGTAIALANTDGAFNAYFAADAYKPDIPSEERLAQAGFGTLPSISGPRQARLDFEVDLAGKGSSGTPSWADNLLVACGFTASGSNFNLAYNASQPTLTIGAYVDGKKYFIAGAAGSVTFPLRAGFPARARFSFLGKIQTPADVALVTPDGSTVKPPRFAGDTVTFGSSNPRLSTLEVAVNNTLAMREDPAEVTGYRSCVITDRRIVVTADPEDNLVATRDYFALISAHTEEAFSAAVGTAANNIITLSSPSSLLQWTNAQNGERNGLQIVNATGQINSDNLRLAFS